MEDKDLFITRIIDAPREMVWKAWTEPWRFMHWWGPKDYTSPVSKIDLRVGGFYLACMRSPDGKDFWSTGEYREIIEPERLVMTDSFADEYGNMVPASYYGFRGRYPMELLVTVTLEDLGDKTKLVLRHSGIDGIEDKDRDGMQQGWNESFDKLDGFLKKVSLTRINAEPGTLDIITIHVFDAPREVVYHVMTDPKLVPMWWGPRRFMTTVNRMNRRPGGFWRFVQHDAEGKEYAFHGEYREIVPSERIVQTFEFEGMPGHVSVETISFDEQDGKTTVTTRSTFETVEDRDGMLAAGAEEGVMETNDRLTELLASSRLGAISCDDTMCSATT